MIRSQAHLAHPVTHARRHVEINESAGVHRTRVDRRHRARVALAVMVLLGAVSGGLPAPSTLAMGIGYCSSSYFLSNSHLTFGLVCDYIDELHLELDITGPGGYNNHLYSGPGFNPQHDWAVDLPAVGTYSIQWDETLTYLDGTTQSYSHDMAATVDIVDGGPTPSDTTAPVMTGLSAPSLVRSANAAFVATWTGSDNKAVKGYQIRTKKGAGGTWSATSSQTSRTRTFRLGAGSWHIAVRARDAAGNLSPWREVTTVVPKDDRSFTFSAGMTRAVNASDFRGTITKTATKSATMTIRFTGSAFYLVGATGRSLGKLRITIDGVSSTVDSGYYKGVRETGSHHRVTLASKGLANKAHVVTISNLGTAGRTTIAIDAVGWRN